MSTIVTKTLTKKLFYQGTLILTYDIKYPKLVNNTCFR